MDNPILIRRGPRSLFRGAPQKGQVFLEMFFSIILMLLLLAGIVNIWNWGNRQILLRQMRYNAGRVLAGTSKDAPGPGVDDPYVRQWPLKYLPSAGTAEEQYRPEHLTEEMVIKDAPQIKAGG